VPVYRGETIIENVERLPDGTSHLLLRIDDDNDLIVDAKNPNKIKGKYKYRFKRIGVVSSNSNEVAAMALPKKTQTQTTMNIGTNIHASSDSNVKNKIPDNASVDQALDQDTSLSSSSSSSSLANENKMPSFNEKRKLFENKAALSLNEPSTTTAPNVAPNVSKSNKVLDLIKQLNQSSSVVSTSKSNKLNDDDGCDEANENDSKEERDEYEQEENDEYNVANENTVTKVTKAKQKRVKQETTVVIEEKYVINDENEEVAKPSKAENQNQNQKVGFIFPYNKAL
jgi:hypothetical protein